jgi:hypothetical protein
MTLKQTYNMNRTLGFCLKRKDLFPYQPQLIQNIQQETMTTIRYNMI